MESRFFLVEGEGEGEFFLCPFAAKRILYVFFPPPMDCLRTLCLEFVRLAQTPFLVGQQPKHLFHDNRPPCIPFDTSPVTRSRSHPFPMNPYTEFTCLYTSQKQKKAKTWHDGTGAPLHSGSAQLGFSVDFCHQMVALTSTCFSTLLETHVGHVRYFHNNSKVNY